MSTIAERLAKAWWSLRVWCCLRLMPTGILLAVTLSATPYPAIAQQTEQAAPDPGSFEDGIPEEAALQSGQKTEAAVTVFSGSAVTMPDAGEVRLNPQDGQRYVWIPPGYFEQGCAEGDLKCKGDERPRRTVRISSGFWMRESEVTVGEYKAFAKAKRRAMPWPPPSGPALLPLLPPPTYNFAWRNEKLPMVMVEWETAQTYCREWAGGRLPTEAEWEYAARAGEAGTLHGDRDALTRADANYGAETCCKPHEEGEDKWKFAAPVKSFPANAYGLFDMQGNVWEWTADWYEADAYERGEEPDPKGPDTGTKRVIRGGAYDNTPDQLRVSERHTAVPQEVSPYIGFRCVHLDLPVR